jgi:hypothetical protein
MATEKKSESKFFGAPLPQVVASQIKLAIQILQTHIPIPTRLILVSDQYGKWAKIISNENYGRLGLIIQNTIEKGTQFECQNLYLALNIFALESQDTDNEGRCENLLECFEKLMEFWAQKEKKSFYLKFFEIMKQNETLMEFQTQAQQAQNQDSVAKLITELVQQEQSVISSAQPAIN